MCASSSSSSSLLSFTRMRLHNIFEIICVQHRKKLGEIKLKKGNSKCEYCPQTQYGAFIEHFAIVKVCALPNKAKLGFEVWNKSYCICYMYINKYIKPSFNCLATSIRIEWLSRHPFSLFLSRFSIFVFGLWPFHVTHIKHCNNLSIFHHSSKTKNEKKRKCLRNVSGNGNGDGDGDGTGTGSPSIRIRTNVIVFDSILICVTFWNTSPKQIDNSIYGWL